MRQLICFFVVRIWHKQFFSWRGSHGMPCRHFYPCILNTSICHLGVYGYIISIINVCILKYLHFKKVQILQLMIWVYTVCQSLYNGTVGILMGKQAHCQKMLSSITQLENFWQILCLNFSFTANFDIHVYSEQICQKILDAWTSQIFKY